MKKQPISEVPPLPEASERRPAGFSAAPFAPENTGYPTQPPSGPHSQAHTPYTSHSPVYYAPPPPPNSAVAPYPYGTLPLAGAYGMPFPPPPAPSPGHADGPAQQPSNFASYPPYPLPHFPPGQGPYPYMYTTGPYPYYAPHAPIPTSEHQPHQNQQLESVERASPNLPPTSAVTRPPPPEQSAALSGYRTIETVSISPLLGASTKQFRNNVSAEGSGEVVFGSFGRAETVKSPSPLSSPVTANEPSNRRSSIAFAIGFDHPPTMRIKRSTSQKDGLDEIVDAVKVVNLTDQQTTLEFGSSDTISEKGKGANLRQESQILQPQPHMLHYPPPSALQSDQFNYGPPLAIPPMSMSLSSHSPQGPLQPLPHHIPSLGPLAPPGFVSPLALATPNPSYNGPVSAGAGDEWEVRDFGYGFGALSGSGYIPERFREERSEREQREFYREQRNEHANGYGGRGRRGGSGYGGYYDGGRGGRRGRGGPNGTGRGFSRGNFSGGRGGHPGAMGRQQPALSVATGPFHHQQPSLHSAQGQQSALHMPQLSPEVPTGSYYVPAPAPGSGHQFAAPSPYGQYNPGFPPAHQMPGPPATTTQTPPQLQLPMPMPLTALSFPLDPIRHYLLGQVEYYFSIQNLASDIFLRNKVILAIDYYCLTASYLKISDLLDGF